MNSTLDAWEILHAVVQLGSFAAAAKQLHRSQSTISYAITRLQEQLGVRLFELRGRKAHLTEAGRMLLTDAEPHLTGFRRLEQRARSLATGGMSEIRLSVDSIYPYERLFAVLAEFSRLFPYTQPRLRQATLLSADAEFTAQHAHLCISALATNEYFVQPILAIELLAVARRDHPLHAHKRNITRVDLMQHMLAVIEDAGSSRRQPRGAAQRYLAVNTIEAAVAAVRSGLCFGWLPRHRIQADLDGGELLPLRLIAGKREARLSLVCRDLPSSGRELVALTRLFGLHRSMETI